MPINHLEIFGAIVSLCPFACKIQVIQWLGIDLGFYHFMITPFLPVHWRAPITK